MDKTYSAYSQGELKSRFCRLWNRCSSAGSGADSETVWKEIISAYSEPWRRYHDIEHLQHCLQQLDEASSHMEDVAAVEMALWFHDIILKPDAPDNEKKSAEFFKHTAGKYFEPSFVEKVSKLILATVHFDPPQEQDARYLCDIDLSSLGSPWGQFLKDSAALRAEQSGTIDAEFYPAKISFLNALLERPVIFLTDYFQSRYEHTARENIRRYITQLGADGNA